MYLDRKKKDNYANGKIDSERIDYRQVVTICPLLSFRQNIQFYKYWI